MRLRRRYPPSCHTCCRRQTTSGRRQRPWPWRMHSTSCEDMCCSACSVQPCTVRGGGQAGREGVIVTRAWVQVRLACRVPTTGLRSMQVLASGLAFIAKHATPDQRAGRKDWHATIICTLPESPSCLHVQEHVLEGQQPATAAPGSSRRPCGVAAPPVAREQRAQRLQALGGAGREAVLAARVLRSDTRVCAGAPELGRGAFLTAGTGGARSRAVPSAHVLHKVCS
jgi:hypothetical protein